MATLAKEYAPQLRLLYFGNGALMSVDVTLSPGFKVGVPKALFQAPITPASVPDVTPHRWDMTPDGKRFLINTVAGDAFAPLTVVLNWQGTGDAETRQSCGRSINGPAMRSKDPEWQEMPRSCDAKSKDGPVHALPNARRGFHWSSDSGRSRALPQGAMEARAPLGPCYRRT